MRNKLTTAMLSCPELSGVVRSGILTCFFAVAVGLGPFLFELTVSYGTSRTEVRCQAL